MKKGYFLLASLFVLVGGCTPKQSQVVIPAPEPFAAFATSTQKGSTLPVTKPLQPEKPTPEPTTEPAPTKPVPEQKPSVEKPVSTSINLAVPFRPQAPFADWSEPYENGCEEASIILVDYYLRGATLSAQQMKDAIDAQVAWQEKQFGGHSDLPMAQVKELAAAQYSYKFRLINDLTIEKIRQELQKGLPVIVPTAGRELGNSNFKQPGPLYHMLVIKGYTADGRFITNDPGTRKGADYVYSSNVLMAAIRDWDAGAHSPDGSKVGLVMYK